MIIRVGARVASAELVGVSEQYGQARLFPIDSTPAMRRDARASIKSGEVIRIQFLDFVGRFSDHADIVPDHEFS